MEKKSSGKFDQIKNEMLGTESGWRLGNGGRGCSRWDFRLRGDVKTNHLTDCKKEMQRSKGMWDWKTWLVYKYGWMTSIPLWITRYHFSEMKKNVMLYRDRESQREKVLVTFNITLSNLTIPSDTNTGVRNQLGVKWNNNTAQWNKNNTVQHIKSQI